MKCPSYTSFFETISNRIRIRVLELLKEGPRSVTDICNSLDEEQSKVSHNLKRLVDCRIVEIEKKGRQRIYSLNRETVIPIMRLVEKHVQKHCRGICPRVK